LENSWKIESVDCIRSQVRLINLSLSQSKSFFLTKLKQATIEAGNLIAVCEDAVWIIDIATGNRKRMNQRSVLNSQYANKVDVYIPEFLKKDRS
jgi:hypothetical protein